MSDDEAKYRIETEYGIEVYRTESDLIAIKQEDPFDTDEPRIIVSPERIDRLIQFLRAIKDEILTDKADRAEERAAGLEPPLTNG